MLRLVAGLPICLYRLLASALGRAAAWRSMLGFLNSGQVFKRLARMGPGRSLLRWDQLPNPLPGMNQPSLEEP